MVQGWETTLQCKFQSLAGEQRPPQATEQLGNRRSHMTQGSACVLQLIAQTNKYLKIFFKKYIQTWPTVPWGATSPKIENHWFRMKDSHSESHLVVSESLWLPGLYSPWNSLGQNTGVGSLSLLQRIFPTQGSNPCRLHCRQILYHLSHQGGPVQCKLYINSWKHNINSMWTVEDM